MILQRAQRCGPAGEWDFRRRCVVFQMEWIGRNVSPRPGIVSPHRC